jgi:uncharacterized iron-regulated membrane protein
MVVFVVFVGLFQQVSNNEVPIRAMVCTALMVVGESALYVWWRKKKRAPNPSRNMFFTTL